MRIGFLARVALVVDLLLIVVPVFAHHGAASYEANKLTTVKGIVTDYQFMNPHTELFVDVTDATTGKVEKWIVEAGSAPVMSRLGWTKSTVKPGDTITIEGHRAKNGSTTMRLKSVVLANGKEFVMERGEDYTGP